MSSLKAPTILAMLVVLAMALVISGCTSPTPTVAPTATPTPAPTGPTLLTVDGNGINTPLNLSLNDLKGYAQNNAAWINSAGNNSFNGTGPRLMDILNQAGMKSDATNITFTGSDKYTASMTVADLKGKYNDTVVAWDWTGTDKNGTKITNMNNTLQLIVPAGGSKNQAKLLVEITVT